MLPQTLTASPIISLQTQTLTKLMTAAEFTHSAAAAAAAAAKRNSLQCCAIMAPAAGGTFSKLIPNFTILCSLNCGVNIESIRPNLMI